MSAYCEGMAYESGHVWRSTTATDTEKCSNCGAIAHRKVILVNAKKRTKKAEKVEQKGLFS